MSHAYLFYTHSGSGGNRYSTLIAQSTLSDITQVEMALKECSVMGVMPSRGTK
jgi:hypothetical protein